MGVNFVFCGYVRNSHMCAHRDLGVRLFSSQFALIPHDWIIGAQSCTPKAKGRSAGGMAFTRDKC